MQDKPIFHDVDVLICFLEINKHGILKKLFSKVVVPKIVYVELNRKSHPNVKKNLKALIGDGFVEIEKIEFATQYYNELFKKDCRELLKDYNFKKHYLSSKKSKKTKI